MRVAPNGDHTAHAVSLLPPTLEHPGGYHCLIGGSVELGESHRAAIVREVGEELGATIHDLTYLDVVANIFQIDGVLGHEIVFVYTGRLDPEPALHGAALTEDDGSIAPVVRRSFDEGVEPLPMSPSQITDIALEMVR